uniref:Uncharacterized protein n=1 Tax=Tanacetum cinerariifolium TaxID=118510 RepID=A0A699HA10_TANCI|nr:hypothetical protein [Tanacetum cinerariifolium]
MTTLVDKVILSGVENHPPMLEKDMYDSWKSIMELYMMNRQHGRMILESIENGPLIWPTIEENGVTRPRKYSELSAVDAIQADCDVKATNIILQGLPPKVYALVSKGKNSTSHARNFIDETGKRYGSPYQSQQYSTNQSSTPLLITYTSNDYQSSVYHNVYCPPSSIPQMEYDPTVNQQHEFPHLDSGRTVPVFKQGDDPIDAINHMMSFLSAVIISRYPTTNNQLRNSSNPRQQATINDEQVEANIGNKGLLFVTTAKGKDTCLNNAQNLKGNGMMLDLGIAEGQATQTVIAYQVNDLDAYEFDCDELNTAKVVLIANLSHYGLDFLAKAAGQNSNSSTQQDALILFVIEQLKTQVINCTKINLDNKSVNDTLTAELERYKEQVKVLKEGQNVEKAQQLEPKLHDDNVIKNTCAIVIPDSEETLMFSEESRLNMLLKQQDLKSISSSYPSPSCRPTKVEVLKELLKVSMVNTSLKKLKHHLAGFDVVVKERTTATTITEEKGMIMTSLRYELRKLKGKALVDIIVTSHTIAPEMLKIDMEPLAPGLLNNRTVHSDYLRLTQEPAVILREVVEQGKS